MALGEAEAKATRAKKLLSEAEAKVAEIETRSCIAEEVLNKAKDQSFTTREEA